VIAKDGAHNAALSKKNPPVVRALLDAGVDVLALNLLLQGDEGFNPDAPTRKVPNPREAAAYTFGYNDPLIIQRTYDVTSALASITHVAPAARKVVLVALDPQTAPIAALAAAATSQNDLQALVVDTGGFRFQNVADIRDPRFLPNTAKYGDLPGLLALNAPRKVFVMGEGPGLPGIATAAYEVAGVPNTVRTTKETDWNAAVKWVEEQFK
jgi:hypothetical protein